MNLVMPMSLAPWPLFDHALLCQTVLLFGLCYTNDVHKRRARLGYAFRKSMADCSDEHG